MNRFNHYIGTLDHLVLFPNYVGIVGNNVVFIIAVTLSHLQPPDPVEYYEQYDINEIKKSAPWVPAVVVCRLIDNRNIIFICSFSISC